MIDVRVDTGRWAYTLKLHLVQFLVDLFATNRSSAGAKELEAS